MQSSIECPVCFNVYAPGTRPPKILITCGHGVCEACVGSLLSKAGGSSIDCPVCRTKCEIPKGKADKLPTMYPLLDLIDSLCGDCRHRPHTQRCGHCPLNLCDMCREVHLEQSSNDTTDDVKTLKHLMDDVNTNISDDQVIQLAQNKGSSIKDRLNKKHKKFIYKLNAEHEKRIASVDSRVAHHIDMVMEWREKARRLVTECSSLLDRLRYSKEYQTKPDDGLDESSNLYKEQLKDKIETLRRIQSSKPDTSSVSMIEIDYQECHLTTPKQVMSRETQTEDIIPPQMLSQHTTTGATLPPPLVLVPDYSAAVIKATFDNDMKWPMGVCIEPITGNVIVTDYNKDEVLILSTELQLVHKFGARGEGDNQYDYPWGVVATGESLYISDCYNHRIHMCNVQGKEFYTFGSKGRGREDFSRPRGLSVDRSGNIYVCDGWNNRVKVVDKCGKYIREFGSDILDGELYFITISADNVVAVTTRKGIIFDGHGHLLVSDWDGGRVAVMKESGDVVEFIGSPGSGPGQLNEPLDLAVTRDGDVVVCDSGNKRVVLFGVAKKSA